MDHPSVIVNQGPKADHHEKLRALLEQKTLAILDAKPELIHSAALNAALFTEALDSVGAIDGDVRREYARRIKEYEHTRYQDVIDREVLESVSILGIACFIVSIMIVICVPSYLAMMKAWVSWEKDLDIISEFVPSLKIAGWAFLLGHLMLSIGSGYRSAIRMISRWKYALILALVFAYALLVFGIAWGSGLRFFV